ncbi:helix-turn-helix domain-containing protein [Rhizobium sp. LjRoot254]|uniref:helix-turn-helix domain-containing protein n=1 Tax=Rhizobium sp. LjRoot254 TaxID=3342297 RepID=UPI003ECEDCE4
MEKYHYKESGLDNVWLVGGFKTEHDEEYGELVYIDDVEGLHKAIAEELLMKKSPLTGAEFKFLRKYCELSQADVANIIQSNEQSVAKWEKAREKAVGNRPAEALFRTFAARVVGGDKMMIGFVTMLNEIHARLGAAMDIEVNHEDGNVWHVEMKAAA